VTATATPLPLDHFLCYEIHRPSINTVVGTSDQFFPNGTSKVRQAKRLCAPVNKNDEDPTAPSHPGHETFYTIKQTAPKFTRTKGINVTVLNDFDPDPGNQPFTDFTVDLVRAERMLVPTSKSLVGPNFPPPLGVGLDHYKCYRVRGARFRRASITVDTQFNTDLTLAIKRPRDLCVPVEKTHDNVVTPILNNQLGLMCFQVRAVPQDQKHVFTTNQFEQGSYDTFGVRDLCVPAVVNPGTCGDNAVNFPGEECDGTDDAACPQACTPSCTCPLPTCGDGALNQQSEECDPPGLNNQCGSGVCQTGCTCAAPVCGDTVVNGGNEECDPPGPSGVCSSGVCGIDCLCAPTFCGDSIVSGNEECDESIDTCPSNPNEFCSVDCTCECEPSFADCVPGQCGSFPDGCGNVVNCSCGPGENCEQGNCVPD
jgi:hypothetical protein